MTIGAQAIPTISSTSSATSSGRGCRDGGERRSASRSARQQAIRRSRRSVRRSGGGSFTNAATRRRTIWRGCSMRTSAVGSTTIGGSTRRLSTRHYGRIDLSWHDGPIGSAIPCAGTRHGPFTGCDASRVALCPKAFFAANGLPTGAPTAAPHHHRTAVYGPLRTVVQKGQAVRLPPLPIVLTTSAGDDRKRADARVELAHDNH